MYKPIIGCLLLCAVCLAGCKKSPAPPTGEPLNAAYYDRQAFILPLNANFALYDSVAVLTGVIDTLALPGPYTTFLVDNNAAENAGWGYVQNGTVLYVQPPPNASTQLLSMIFRGARYLDSMTVGADQVWPSVSGLPAYIGKYVSQGDTLYTFNGVLLSEHDFPATNGPIQVVDAGIPNIQTYASIAAYVNSQLDLTYLAVALERSGLESLLNDTTRVWTFLAPVNSAFQNSPDPSLNSLDSLLTADTAKLANLIRFHLLAGRQFIFDYDYLSGSLSNGSTGATDSVRLYPFGGKSIDYVNQSGAAYFYALGDSTYQYNYNTGNYAWVPSPVSVQYSGYGEPAEDNRLTGNGIVHELSGLLLP